MHVRSFLNGPKKVLQSAENGQATCRFSYEN